MSALRHPGALAPWMAPRLAHCLSLLHPAATSLIGLGVSPASVPGCPGRPPTHPPIHAPAQALSAGVDSFGFEDRAAVRQAFEDLRMERPEARKILDGVARK